MPFSPNNTSKVRDAIDQCVQSHPRCQPSGRGTNPLRLVNVMDGDVIKIEHAADQRHVYAALSYCWGSSSSINAARTAQHNLDERTTPFPLSTLPPTLKDAVLLTRSIGIKYLWIDAICIVQDDETEWETEAQKMMQYYGHARVTIVPIHANSADSGMKVGQNPPFSRAFSGPWTVDSGSNLILTNLTFGAREAVRKSAWNQRGWTYQEMLNSTRLLFCLQP